jgi:hypothetical protein
VAGTDFSQRNELAIRRQVQWSESSFQSSPKKTNPIEAAAPAKSPQFYRIAVTTTLEITFAGMVLIWQHEQMSYIINRHFSAG